MYGYFEEIDRSKYLTLVPTNEVKEKIKKYEELCSKFRDLIGSIIKNSGDYDEKYMKIKLNLDYDLPQNKTIEIHNVTKVVKVFLLKRTNMYRFS